MCVRVAPRLTRRLERPRAGLSFKGETLHVRRTAAETSRSIVDAQNLYFGAREAFGYTYPNYDVRALARALCAQRAWDLVEIRFYTGVPDEVDNKRWSRFWNHKLAAMGRQGVRVYSRPLRYRNQRVRLPDGSEFTFLTGEEKGIDVRLAIDVIRKAHRQEFDVALIFSQDQDLSEVAKELRQIAREQRRWIKVASAFPRSPTSTNRRGIDQTDWIPIDRITYDACLDRRDYRAKDVLDGEAAP